MHRRLMQMPTVWPFAHAALAGRSDLFAHAQNRDFRAAYQAACGARYHRMIDAIESPLERRADHRPLGEAVEEDSRNGLISR